MAVILTNRSDLTCDALISDQVPGHAVKYANQDSLVISLLTNSGTVTPGPYNATGTYETTTADAGPESSNRPSAAASR